MRSRPDSDWRARWTRYARIAGKHRITITVFENWPAGTWSVSIGEAFTTRSQTCAAGSGGSYPSAAEAMGYADAWVKEQERLARAGGEP